MSVQLILPIMDVYLYSLELTIKKTCWEYMGLRHGSKAMLYGVYRTIPSVYAVRCLGPPPPPTPDCLALQFHLNGKGGGRLGNQALEPCSFLSCLSLNSRKGWGLVAAAGSNLEWCSEGQPFVRDRRRVEEWSWPACLPLGQFTWLNTRGGGGGTL